MKIPIVVTTQASQTRSKGGRLNAESAMYTQAWRQSADVHARRRTYSSRMVDDSVRS